MNEPAHTVNCRNHTCVPADIVRHMMTEPVVQSTSVTTNWSSGPVQTTHVTFLIEFIIGLLANIYLINTDSPTVNGVINVTICVPGS